MKEPLIRVVNQRLDGWLRGRTIDFIRMLQERGLVDKRLDVNYVGPALSLMVVRFAYISFVEQASIGNKTDIERSVAALTVIWTRALGLEPGSRRSKLTRSTAMPLEPHGLSK